MPGIGDQIDGATMSFADETRRFSRRGAESVCQLLDMLAYYTVESAVRLELGEWEPARREGTYFVPCSATELVQACYCSLIYFRARSGRVVHVIATREPRDSGMDVLE